MRVVHPVADEWGEDYTVYAASARSVLLTEPLAAFLDHATTERVRPVLLTDAHARLSPFVSLAMRRAGGLWAVRDASGVFDGLSGYRIDAFSDLWRRSGTDRDRLPAFGRLRTDPGGVLMFDVFAHQRASARTQVGQLAPAVVAALGGAAPDVWGLHEPLVEAWDAAALTETARRAMPVSPVMHVRAADGSFCDVTVARTRRGVLEHAKGGVPIGPYPRATADTADVVQRGAATLSMVAEAFGPTIGFVSLAEFDDGVTQGASARRHEAPLAVVIGPRGVHDLRIDPGDLARRHDVTLLGRRRLPSLLVRFSDPDVGLWAQLTAFAHDLGPERIAAAAGLDGRD